MGFKVLCWNVNGIDYYGSTSPAKIITHINNIDADILCLQEIPVGKIRKYYLKMLSYYPFVSSVDYPAKIIEGNNNLIFSKYKILQTGELFFSMVEKEKQHFENALWVDIKIYNQKVRIYNCHFKIIGGGISHRIMQLKKVINHCKKLKYPVIICGDLNTTIVKEGFSRKIIQLFHKEPNKTHIVNGKYILEDERYFFYNEAKKLGFIEALPLKSVTWATPPFKIELFKRKLDWFLTKKLIVKKATLGDYISDHRPICVDLDFKKTE